MRFLSAFRGWLGLSDYDSAREDATTSIVSRFSRGNVSVQNGKILDESELKALSSRGDADLRKLNRLAGH